jgi:hypothetical protein
MDRRDVSERPWPEVLESRYATQESYILSALCL